MFLHTVLYNNRQEQTFNFEYKNLTRSFERKNNLIKSGYATLDDLYTLITSTQNILCIFRLLEENEMACEICYDEQLKNFWDDCLELSGGSDDDRFPLYFGNQNRVLKTQPGMHSLDLLRARYYYDAASYYSMIDNHELMMECYLKASEFKSFDAICTLNKIDLEELTKQDDKSLDMENCQKIINRMLPLLEHGAPGYIHLGLTYMQLAIKFREKEFFKNGLKNLFLAKLSEPESYAAMHNAYGSGGIAVIPPNKFETIDDIITHFHNKFSHDETRGMLEQAEDEAQEDFDEKNTNVTFSL